MLRPVVGVLTTPVALSVALGVLILGPVLAPGTLLAYDMAWSPIPRWTPFVLGAGTPAPRAVPSDAVAVLLGSVLGASIAQKLVLLGVLALAGTGAATLLRELRPHSSQLAAGAAVIAAIWNPFVAERLAVGQWTVLLGYAVLPWLLRATVRLHTHPGDIWAAACWVVVAAFGGANSLLIASLGVVPVVTVSVGRWRSLATLSLVWLGSAAAWALPGLFGGARHVTSGLTDFRPHADTPFGVVMSLISGGGFWNAATHPPPRGTWIGALGVSVLAVTVALIAARCLWTRGGRAVLGVGVVGLGLCLVSLAPFWSVIVAAVPGGGLLRDSQKFLASWVLLLALGSGLTVEALFRIARRQQWAGALGVAVVVAPIALLPTLAWGLAGRLQSVTVPDGYLQVADVASALPTGEAGLLPWGQYRRYVWNGSRVSLTLAPRIIDQPLLFDDSLPLTAGRVDGEDPRAARVGGRIDAGMDPATALIQEGVRYLIIELGTGLPSEVPEGVGTVVAQSPQLVVLDVVGSPGASSSAPDVPVLGWVLSTTTASVVLLGAAWGKRRRNEPLL